MCVSITSALHLLPPCLLLDSPIPLPTPVTTLASKVISSDRLTNGSPNSSRDTNAAGGNEGSDTVESRRRSNADLVTTALAVSTLAAACGNMRTGSWRVGVEEGVMGG